MVSLGCWAEQPQLCSSSYSGNVTSRTRQNRSQSDAPGPKTDLRIVSLRPERPDAMVQGLEGRPLWGRAVYTALHGARLSSVPSGDQSANPASVLGHSGLQRALLSVSSAQKCSGDGRLATPSGVSRAARSAVPCRSSVPGHRASRSKYTRGQSQETGSLISHLAVWEPLPSVFIGICLSRLWFLVFLRDDVGLRTVISNRRLLKQS